MDGQGSPPLCGSATAKLNGAKGNAIRYGNHVSLLIEPVNMCLWVQWKIFSREDREKEIVMFIVTVHAQEGNGDHVLGTSGEFATCSSEVAVAGFATAEAAVAAGMAAVNRFGATPKAVEVRTSF